MDPKLLDFVVCPVTHSRLRQEGDYLIAERGGLKYPIKDGIPALLPQEAVLPEGISTLDEFKKRYPPQP